MELTKDQVIRIANHARIHLTDDEIERILPDLNSILNLIKQLDEIDTSNIEQIDQITGLKNVIFNDNIETFPDMEKLIDCSPMGKKNNMIRVKKSK